MIKNQDKLFDCFVNTFNGWIRPVLENPFRDGDYVFASDGHSVISVHQSQVKDPDDYYESTQLNAPQKFKLEDNCSEVFTVKGMKEAMKKLPRYRKCPECKGSGEVKFKYVAKTSGYEYTILHDCPECFGRGEITHRHAAKIGDNFYTFHQLIGLRAAAEAVGVRSVTQIYKSADMNIFRVNDYVKVGLMALHLDRDNEHIIKNPIIV